MERRDRGARSSGRERDQRQETGVRLTDTDSMARVSTGVVCAREVGNTTYIVETKREVDPLAFRQRVATLTPFVLVLLAPVFASTQ